MSNEIDNILSATPDAISTSDVVQSALKLTDDAVFTSIFGSNLNSNWSLFLFTKLKPFIFPISVVTSGINLYYRAKDFIKAKNKNANLSTALGLAALNFSLITLAVSAAILGFIGYSLFAPILFTIVLSLGTTLNALSAVWNTGKLIALKPKVGDNYDVYSAKKQEYKHNIKTSLIGAGIGAVATVGLGILMLSKLGAIALGTFLGAKITVHALTGGGAAGVTIAAAIPNAKRFYRSVKNKCKNLFNWINNKLSKPAQVKQDAIKQDTAETMPQEQMLDLIKKLGARAFGNSEPNTQPDATMPQVSSLLNMHNNQISADENQKYSENQPLLTNSHSGNEQALGTTYNFPYAYTKQAVLGDSVSKLIAKSLSDKERDSELRQNAPERIEKGMARDILLSQIGRKISELKSQIRNNPTSSQNEKRNHKIQGLEAYENFIKDTNKGLDEFKSQRSYFSNQNPDVYHSFWKQQSDYKSIEDAVEAYYIQCEATKRHAEVVGVYTRKFTAAAA